LVRSSKPTLARTILWSWVILVVSVPGAESTTIVRLNASYYRLA